MKHLKDELPPSFELSLLTSEALDAPSDASREYARKAGLAALGVGAAVGAGAATAGTSAGAASAGAKTGIVVAGWKAIAVGVAVGGVTVGTGLAIARAPHESVAPSAPSSAVSGVVASPAPKAIASATPLPEPAVVKDEPIVVAPTPSGSARVAVSARPTVTISVPEIPAPTPTIAEVTHESAADLAGEVRTLDGVRDALGQHNAARAIEQLDAYATAYPSGTLAPEAKALRVEAFAMRGERDEAMRLAKELLAAHPAGPYRKRLEKALGGPIP